MSDLKDRLWEVMRRNEERADALDLERQKAEIRQWSYALKWTGTPDELTATITKWYESGWIVAESLQDALQMASIHFVKPDGMPVLKPASTPREAVRLKTLDGSYQVIEFDGRQYGLTKIQATVIRVLHEAQQQKRSSVGLSEIQKAMHINTGKMSHWFRGKNKSLYGKLIVQTASRNHYPLDL